MPNGPTSAIEIARAEEQLRQERETFDQRKRHEARWFLLRLVFGYGALAFFGAIIAIAGFVVFNSTMFPDLAVKAAGGALFVTPFGIIGTAIKLVLSPAAAGKLEPVTKVRSR